LLCRLCDDLEASTVKRRNCALDEVTKSNGRAAVEGSLYVSANALNQHIRWLRSIHLRVRSN
jgi:hypothetical protein